MPTKRENAMIAGALLGAIGRYYLLPKEKRKEKKTEFVLIGAAIGAFGSYLLVDQKDEYYEINENSEEEQEQHSKHNEHNRHNRQKKSPDVLINFVFGVVILYFFRISSFIS